ncbi:helix-turn-helix domain-containing protein [Ancylobacter moscoviensis]
MSIHVSPFSGSFRSARADAPLASYPFAPVPAPAAPRSAGLPDDGFSVRLGHMGVVVAISSPVGGADALDQSGETIRLEVAPEDVRRCAGVLAGSTVANAADPVVSRLSQALEAAEHDGREFGGLYADALRLAIVTRLLSVPGFAKAEPDCDDRAFRPSIEPIETSPAEDPASAPRRPKSGLPKWRFKRVAAYVEENLGEAITLAGMATAAGLSRMHFAAQFRVATGMRPHEYLLRRRIERAQEMLLETRDPLVEIALAVGFQTQAHFTTVFRRFVGDTPYQWRCANRVRN